MRKVELRGWSAALVIAAILSFVIGAALALRYFLIEKGLVTAVADGVAILFPFAFVALAMTISLLVQDDE